MSKLQKGDYVLATKYSDGDPYDGYGVGYGFNEPTPEERAERSVDAIWSAHSEELQDALRKLTENAAVGGRRREGGRYRLSPEVRGHLRHQGRVTPY